MTRATLLTNAALGTAISAAAALGVTLGHLEYQAPTPTLAVIVGVLVVVPLATVPADHPYRDGGRSAWYRGAAIGSLPAGVLAAVSLSLQPGPSAAALAAPWLLVTLSLAIYGLQRWFPNTTDPPETAVSVGMIYLPSAGMALVLHRLGSPGLDSAALLFAAVHLVYGGCALPVYAGVLGRTTSDGPAYRSVLAPVVVGPFLITLATMYSGLLQVLALSLLVIAVTGLAVIALHRAPVLRTSGGALVGVAATSLAVSTLTLPVYLAAPAGGFPTVSTASLVHGALGALGFGVAGLLGCVLLDPPPRIPPLGLPISDLTSRGSLGPGYLESYGVEGEGDPDGMVEEFQVFSRDGFEAEDVDPAVRRFYTHTGSYELDVRPSWSPGYGRLAGVYAWFSRRLGQMNFPSEDGSKLLSSRIESVDDYADGRTDVSAWIRRYEDTGETIYVALYSTHELDGETYMNIAFPLPATNLTSVLHLEPHPGRPGGITLTTTSGRDSGIYLRTPLGPLRLPMDETIEVWSNEQDTENQGSSGGIDAVHDMYLFGRRFLRLDYRISRAE